jgi:hypothetical protein
MGERIWQSLSENRRTWKDDQRSESRESDAQSVDECRRWRYALRPGQRHSRSRSRSRSSIISSSKNLTNDFGGGSGSWCGRSSWKKVTLISLQWSSSRSSIALVLWSHKYNHQLQRKPSYYYKLQRQLHSRISRRTWLRRWAIRLGRKCCNQFGRWSGSN